MVRADERSKRPHRRRELPADGGAVWNNVVWIIFHTGFVLAFGLIVAELGARVRNEAVMKAIVFLPMAIPATADICVDVADTIEW